MYGHKFFILDNARLEKSVRIRHQIFILLLLLLYCYTAVNMAAIFRKIACVIF